MAPTDQVRPTFDTRDSKPRQDTKQTNHNGYDGKHSGGATPRPALSHGGPIDLGQQKPVKHPGTVGEPEAMVPPER